MGIARLSASILAASLLNSAPVVADERPQKPATYEVANGQKSTHEEAHTVLHIEPVIEGMISAGAVVGSSHHEGPTEGVAKIDLAAGVHMGNPGSRHSGSVLGGAAFLGVGPHDKEACLEGIGSYNFEVSPRALSLYVAAMVGGCMEFKPNGNHFAPLTGGTVGIVLNDNFLIGVTAEGNPADPGAGAKVLGGIGFKFPLKSSKH